MTTHDDEWMTIREASLAMNVSELTIRRRIKDGRLAHRMVDGKYFVNRSAPPPAVKTVTRGDSKMHTVESARSGDATADPGSARVSIEQFLPEYGRVAEIAGRASVLEERLKEIALENQSLRDNILSLAGRNGWLESKLEERENELRMLADSRKKRSFWSRLFGTDPNSR